MELLVYKRFALTLVLALTILIPVPSSAAPGDPCGWLTTPAPEEFDHVVWIIYENKPFDMIFKSGHAPYITGLAEQCGRADNMHHVYPRSLPNYIAMTSGTTGNVTSNGSPNSWPQNQVSLFEQLGPDWRQLNESMPTNCTTKGSGEFTVNHAPSHYYTRIRDQCQLQSVPMGATLDISARFTLVIPNKIHDMHNTTSTPTIPSRIKAGDDWTRLVIPQLLATDEYRAGKTAIFLTWDEANARTSHIPFVAISPYTAPGMKSTTAFTHYSLLKATEEMLGISVFLGKAAEAGTTSIRSAFNLG